MGAVHGGLDAEKRVTIARLSANGRDAGYIADVLGLSEGEVLQTLGSDESALEIQMQQARNLLTQERERLETQPWLRAHSPSPRGEGEWEGRRAAAWTARQWREFVEHHAVVAAEVLSSLMLSAETPASVRRDICLRLLELSEAAPQPRKSAGSEGGATTVFYISSDKVQLINDTRRQVLAAPPHGQVLSGGAAGG